MKKKFQILMFCVVIFCCAAASYAQQRPTIGGGFKVVDVNDAAVQEAAEFAVSDHSEKNEVSLEIVSIEKAERQTVAGTNFRMCIEVKVVEEGNDETQMILAVVNKNLKSEFKLLSWKADGCAKKEE